MAKKKSLAKSKASKQGWITRRRAAKERSNAAKRGWKTRRKNQRKKKKIIVNPLERLFLITLMFSKGKGKKPPQAEALVKAKSINEIKNCIEKGRIPETKFQWIEWTHSRKGKRHSTDEADFEEFVRIATGNNVEDWKD